METSQNEKKNPSSHLQHLAKTHIQLPQAMTSHMEEIAQTIAFSGLVQETSRPYYLKKNFPTKD